MCRYYARPCLLIEFDTNRPFSLSGTSELAGEISEKNVVSKMVLLTRHFPKLRILWSRSPTNTVEIFAQLKRGQAEPEPEAAAAAGCPEDARGRGGGQGAGAAAAAAAAAAAPNLPAQDVLRRVAGVTSTNMYAIMRNVRSLHELATMTVAELTPIMGKAGATKLVAFFAKRVAAAELGTAA